MLVDSPVFTRARLQLLAPQRYPALMRAMYSLLMLCPQSTSFQTLQARLSSVPTLALLKLNDAGDAADDAAAARGGGSGASSGEDGDGAAAAAGGDGSARVQLPWAEMLEVCPCCMRVPLMRPWPPGPASPAAQHAPLVHSARRCLQRVRRRRGARADVPREAGAPGAASRGAREAAVDDAAQRGARHRAQLGRRRGVGVQRGGRARERRSRGAGGESVAGAALTAGRAGSTLACACTATGRCRHARDGALRDGDHESIRCNGLPKEWLLL